MITYHAYKIVLLLMVLALCSCTADGLFQSLTDAEEKEFDEHTKALIDKSELLRKAIIRFRDVKLNGTYLSQNVIKPGLAGQQTKPVDVELFDKLSVRIITKKVQQLLPHREQKPPSKRYSWVGHLEGDETNKVILTVRDEAVSGTIHYKGKLYEIRPVSQGVHAIYELDEREIPDESPIENKKPKKISKKQRSAQQKSGAARALKNGGGQIQHDGPLVAADALEGEEGEARGVFEGEAFAQEGAVVGAPCVVDVLVVYTTDAKNASDNIVKEIEDLVERTNETFAFSGIDQLKINLVGTPSEVPYTETHDLDLDAALLPNPANKPFDQVHSLRDTLQADLVSLWVSNTGKRNNFCGSGAILSPFSVVDFDCARTHHSFAHEIGHSMGAYHDRDSLQVHNDGNYSYGHINNNNNVKQRTIMGIAQSTCPGCERIPYWSNPDKKEYVDGSPMGVPLSHPEAADNRKVLNENACIVSKNRP